MNRRNLLFATLTVVGFCFALSTARAQETPYSPAPIVPAISTSTSQDYPQVSCTSSDPMEVADTLQLASETRDELGSLLQLGPTWRFPVHIHIMTPDDPLMAKINREAAAFFAQGNTMRLEAVIPSTDPNMREFVQRQFVTALLCEKFFANTTTFDKNTRLDVIPFWLVEGLRGWLDREDPTHQRESIVERAVQNQSAPTLDEVTGWHELSDDRLLGIWQRAFCYYLVDSMVRTDVAKNDFQLWLGGFAGASSSTAQLHFPTQADWQRELADASKRSHDRFYTWDETLTELTAAESISFAASKDAKVQTCPLDSASTLPRTSVVQEALQEKVFLLTELEIRAHPSWNRVLELYRAGLAALVKDNHPDEAQKLLDEAKRERIAEMDYHQKLLDYMNWFEVTKDYSGNTTDFGDYFTTARQMERVEADPDHPNPIRANLLQIESEL